MSKNDIIRKLTSRKFWVAVASFVTLIMTAYGVTENAAAQVSAIIMAGATVLGYVLAEGLTDAAAIETESGTEAEAKTETESESDIDTDEDMNDEDDEAETEGVG